jgi:hypothetical protein
VTRKATSFEGKCVGGPWNGQGLASRLTTIFIYESCPGEVAFIRIAGTYIYQFKEKEWKWVVQR